MAGSLRSCVFAQASALPSSYCHVMMVAPAGFVEFLKSVDATTNCPARADSFYEAAAESFTQNGVSRGNLCDAGYVADFVLLASVRL